MSERAADPPGRANGRSDETTDGDTLGRLLRETANLIEDAEIICGIPSFNNVHTIDPKALNNEKYQTTWQNLISG